MRASPWGGKNLFGTMKSEGRHWSTEARASLGGAHCPTDPRLRCSGILSESVPVCDPKDGETMPEIGRSQRENSGGSS